MSPVPWPRGAGRAAVALAPLALLADGPRHWLESRMLWHMLLEFPLLLASGVVAGSALARYAPRVAHAWARCDAGGLLGLVVLSGLAGLWMLPVALDAALVWPMVAASKYGSWWLAGLAIAQAWPRMADATRLFLAGNLAWMFATAGLLYTEAEVRLCVNYLQDEQVWTGRALLLLAMALIGWMAWSAYRTSSSGPRSPAPAATRAP